MAGALTEDYTKLPRLYMEADLAEGRAVDLPAPQAHYLRGVMRRGAGDHVRLFNGRQGEWLAAIAVLDRKNGAAVPVRLLKAQPPEGARVRLVCAPVKKARMDVMIEKAVELGVTDFHPVLTRHTEARNLNEERIRAQVAEAAEQCERLDMPVWHAARALPDLLGAWPGDRPLIAALEREEGLPSLRAALGAMPAGGGDAAFLIGPEGGFADEEKAMIRRCGFVVPASLGPLVLRSETAALACLAALLSEKA